MNNNFTKSLLLALIVIFMSSCQTDYNGEGKINKTGIIAFGITNDTMDVLTRKKTRVFWNSNDEDSYLVDYYWTVSADMSINEDNVLQKPVDWTKTTNQFADVAFPYNGDSVKFFIDSTVVPVKVIRYVYSRMYLYAKDDLGNATKVISRGFWRTNKKPDRVTLKCFAFNWDAYIDEDGIEHTFQPKPYQSINRPFVFLEGNQRVKFSWNSIDKDGSDVELTYKYELWKLDEIPTVALDSINSSGPVVLTYPSTLKYSSEWGIGNKELQADSLVGSHGPGVYKLIVRVKDDAEEESEDLQYGVFEAIKPVYDKGILFVDKTPTPTANELIGGNPTRDSVTAFHRRMYSYAGYTEDNPNPLKRIHFYDDNNNPIKYPDLKDVLSYRLVVLTSDSRKTIDNLTDGSSSNPGFGRILKEYMDFGGKVLLTGANVLVSSSSDAYIEPKSFPATGLIKKDYFGIATVTSSEGFEKLINNVNRNNYDFIGTKIFDHVLASDSLHPMRVDSAKVNRYWKRKIGTSQSWEVKGDGFFLPNCISTIKSIDGEIIMGYESVYNDPVLSLKPELVTAGSGSNTQPVLNRNDFDGMLPNAYSAVATRLVGPLDKFRTAYIGIPLSFMDNKNQVVYKNIKSMVKWLDLNQVPSSLRQKK